MSVSQELHDRVLDRDGDCFLYKLDASHVCRDQWGYPHPSHDQSKLTLDHVHLHAGGTRGKRAPDDEQHLVTMCAAANIGGPSRVVRQAQREYLQALYGEGGDSVERGGAG